MTFVRASMLFDTDNPDELKRLLGHHIDYIVDMENNHDVINQYASAEEAVDELNKLLGYEYTYDEFVDKFCEPEELV